MRFRNSFRLLIENFRHSYKILVYQTVTLLISAGLYCAFLLPELNTVANSAEFAELKESVSTFFTVLFHGEDLTQFVDRIHNALTNVAQLLGSMSGSLVWAAVGCVLVYLVMRVADTMCTYNIGSLLNDRMSIYATTPFWTAFVKNLGKSALYAVVYVPIAFLWDVLTVAACYFFFFYLSSFSTLFVSLALSVTLIAVCQAVKLTVSSVWMPAMTADNLSIGKAMKCLTKEERKQRNQVFSVSLVNVYIIIVVNVLAAICTFGSALILTVPTSYLLLVCTQYVNYYIVKGKKYFLTYEEIEKDVSCGDSGHFFDYVIEDETQSEGMQDKTENVEQENDQIKE
ncbi:MAG: hypothetical protein IJY38_04035 [Clostridia bacterium]|nr:hypothetical protein [Clostridia bacterium]